MIGLNAEFFVTERLPAKVSIYTNAETESVATWREKKKNYECVCILILSISETSVNFNCCTQCTRECHLKGVIREMLKQKIQMNELQEQHTKFV